MSNNSSRFLTCPLGAAAATVVATSVFAISPTSAFRALGREKASDTSGNARFVFSVGPSVYLFVILLLDQEIVSSLQLNPLLNRVFGAYGLPGVGHVSTCY